MISLLSEFDPDYAAELYSQYKTHFNISRFGFNMFREWPAHETSLGADIDSGPIIWGAGLTATGVGLAAARSQGDQLTESDIRDLSKIFGFMQIHRRKNHPEHEYLFGQLAVGDAFLTWGYSIQRPELNPNSTLAQSRIVRLLNRWTWFLTLAILVGLVCVRAFFYQRKLNKQNQAATQVAEAEAV